MDFENWGKRQVIALVGFMLLIFSIPLGMILVKNYQIFNSGAAAPGPHPTPGPRQTATTPQEVPVTSPVGELEKYLSTASAQPSSAPSPIPSPASIPAVSFGPTLNLKVSLEGRPSNKQAVKAFVGIAPGATSSAQPKFLLSFMVDFPDSGEFDGLSLAGLDRSSVYTAYIKGPSHIDSASTFTIGPAAANLNNGQPLTLLAGDLNEDNTVNSADYSIAKSLLGKKTTDADFNPRADFNGDGVINILDLAYITKNFGKTGSSGVWYSPIPAASSSAIPAGGPTIPAGGISTDSAAPAGGGYWIWIP